MALHLPPDASLLGCFFEPNVSKSMDDHARWSIAVNCLTEDEIARRLTRKGYKHASRYVRRFMTGLELCANQKFLDAVMELACEQHLARRAPV